MLSHPVLRSRGGASPPALERAMRRWDLPLDGVLREWFEFCNGVSIGPEALYGLEQSEPDLDVDVRRSLGVGWAEAGWVPVAGDGFGNSYVVDMAGKTVQSHQAVIFVEAVDPLEPVYAIASNMWTFVEKYVRRDEPGSSGWEVWDLTSAMRSDPELADVRGVVPMPWEL